MREKIREVIGDVGRGSQHEALRDGIVARINLHVRTAFCNAVGNVERETVTLAHEAKRPVARILRVPFLRVVAERRALPHVRARGTPTIGHIEHLAREGERNRVGTVGVRRDLHHLRVRPVLGMQLHVRATCAGGILHVKLHRRIGVCADSVKALDDDRSFLQDER